MNDEITERVLNDNDKSTAETSLRRTIVDEHRAAFGLFVVSGGTLTVMFAQGLVNGKLYVGMLPLVLIPSYCLYRIWRGVQDSKQEER